MSDFTRLAEHLGATDTVAIVTTRLNGDEVATPIWATAVDGGYLAGRRFPGTL